MYNWIMTKFYLFIYRKDIALLDVKNRRYSQKYLRKKIKQSRIWTFWLTTDEGNVRRKFYETNHTREFSKIEGVPFIIFTRKDGSSIVRFPLKNVAEMHTEYETILIDSWW